MKLRIMSLLILLTASQSFAASKTVMKCAVGNVTGGDGARVNLIENEKGQTRANLIFGTTVSGTMYSVAVDESTYKGSIKGKSAFVIELIVTNQAASNKYVNGYKASLKAIYPDLRNADGTGSVATSPSDQFVCGEQIAPFGR